MAKLTEIPESKDPFGLFLGTNSSLQFEAKLQDQTVISVITYSLSP